MVLIEEPFVGGPLIGPVQSTLGLVATRRKMSEVPSGPD